MPPEQDDYRERQLAALRRYVADLDVRRQPAAPRPRPAGPRRRPPWPWVLATLALMAVSLAGGFAIGAARDPGDRPASGFAAVTTGSGPPRPAAAPECAEAVERANRSISHAVGVSTALRQHSEVMNDLLQGRIDTDAALRAGAPSLVAGAAEAAKLDLALADYRKVVDRCQLRAP
jgi:hypothetical protein